MKKEGQYTLLETLSFLKHYLHYLGTTGFGYFRLGEWKKKKSQSIKPQDFSYFFRLYQAVRTGLEPATPGVTGLYSNQLNYRTKIIFIISKKRCGRDSNPRPHA